MSFCVERSKRIVLALGFVLAALIVAPVVQAQAPVQSEEDQQLEKLLSGAELFFKKGFNEQAQRWEYQVAWSQGGETSLITLYIRQIGTISGKRVVVAYGWTQILAMPQGQDVPPAVIKEVARVNGILFTGNVSTEPGGVFANTGVVIKDLTSDALWIYLWDLHDTRTVLKKEFGKILAGG